MPDDDEEVPQGHPGGRPAAEPAGRDQPEQRQPAELSQGGLPPDSQNEESQ